MIKKYKSIILYGIFGIATTFVNLLVYFICSKIINFNILNSTLIAWVIAVIFAFVTNKIWVFESKTTNIKDILKEILSFFSCRLITGFLDLIIMYIFVDKLHFNDMLIKIISNIVVIILNYIASKLLIFKKEKNKSKNNKKYDSSDILILITIFIMAFLVSMKSPQNFLQNGISSIDSSVFRLIGLLMSKGYTPYIDTFDHKGPLIYLINFIGYIINKNNGIWIIEMIFIFVSFLFIYKIAKIQNKKFSSLIILLFTIVNLFTYLNEGNIVEEYALPFILISLYIFIDYFQNKNINKLKLIICGACFACVCLLRINMISCWAVFCLAILIKCIIDKSYKELLNYIIYFLIGVCIITVPIILWLSLKGAFSDFIFDYFIFNFKYTVDAGLLPTWHTLFYFLKNSIVTIVILINIFAIIKEKNKSMYISNLCFLFLSLLTVSMSGRTYNHYAIVLVPTFVIPISYIINFILKHKNDNLTIFIAIYLLSILVVPSWESLIEKIGVMYSYNNHNISQIDDNLATIKDLINKNTTSNDKISVYGNWDIVYLISNRLPASKYSYQFPIGEINPQIFEEYFYDLKKNNAKIIVVKNSYNSKINDFVKNNNYDELWNNEDEKIYVFIKNEEEPQLEN